MTHHDQWTPLEELARAASREAWEASGASIQAHRGGTLFVSYRGNGKSEDAAFIAAANPSTVLALIAAARAGSVGIDRQVDEPSPSRSESLSGPLHNEAEQGLRERVARIVDPEAWDKIDGERFAMASLEGDGPMPIMRADLRRQHHDNICDLCFDSLTKADAILQAISQHPVRGKVDG